MGALRMEANKPSSDAHRWMHDRYIKDDPDALAFLKEVRIQADLAGQIYTIRNKLRMSRDDLAEFSGLTAEVIEDLEESDYDGDWEDAIRRVNAAFRSWIASVIIPVAQMKPDDYSVKVVGA